MTRTGRVPHLMTHIAGPRLALHPRDAARRGSRTAASRGSKSARKRCDAGVDRRRDARGRCVRADALDRPVLIVRAHRSAGARRDRSSLGQPDLREPGCRSRPSTKPGGAAVRRAAGDPALDEGVHWSRTPLAAGFAYGMAGCTPLAELIDSENALRSLFRLRKRPNSSPIQTRGGRCSAMRPGRRPIGGLCVLRGTARELPRSRESGASAGKVLDPIDGYRCWPASRQGPPRAALLSAPASRSAKRPSAARSAKEDSPTPRKSAPSSKLEPIAAPAFPNSRSCCGRRR